MATSLTVPDLESLRAQMAAIANAIQRLEATASTTSATPAAASAPNTATGPAHLVPAKPTTNASGGRTVQRSVSSLRIAAASGAIPPARDRLSVGRAPARSASTLYTPTDSVVLTASAVPTTPTVLATPAIFSAPPLPAATTGPPSGALPTYLATTTSEDVLATASGGLLSRMIPFQIPFIPEEPKGSPGRGKGSYKIEEILGISRGVNRGIRKVLKYVADHTPEIDRNKAITHQRPKGIVEDMIKYKVIPLLPQFKIYEKHGYWPLLKYYNTMLRSSSNLFRLAWAKANPELAELKKKKKGKGNGPGKAKAKATGRVKGQVPVERPDESEEEVVVADEEEEPAHAASAGIGPLEDVLQGDGSFSAGATVIETDNDGDDDDFMDRLIQEVSGISISMKDVHANTDEDEDEDILMSPTDVLPVDLLSKAPTTRLSTPVLSAPPFIEHATSPAKNSPWYQATPEPTNAFTFNNTATSTASSMSTSAATITVSVPSIIARQPPPPTITSNMPPMADALAHLLQMPDEYIATLPSTLVRALQDLRPGSSVLPPCDPAIVERPKPRMRPPPVKSMLEPTEAVSGDSPALKPVENQIASSSSASRGQGGGRGGKRNRGGVQATGKNSVSNVGEIGGVGPSQGGTTRRMTRALSAQVNEPAPNLEPAKRRTARK